MAVTFKRYLDEPALSGVARITALVEGPRPALRLDRTWFHPQGGGQKADRGTIDGVSLVHVAHADGGEVDHVVESVDGFAVGQEVALAIDAAWRLENTRFHTAGHLIGEALERKMPFLLAVGGHHWPGEARLEFAIDGDPPHPSDAVAVLEKALADAIAQDWTVAVSMDENGYRAVTLDNGRPVGCGGTHLASVGGIGAVEITGTKLKGDRLRIAYDLDPAH